MHIQRRFKSVCTSIQSDQSLSFPTEETLNPWVASVLCTCLFACEIWYFTSQSTIYQLCRDGSSWTSTKQGFMCFAQGHHAVTPAGLKPATPRSRVKHSITAHPVFAWWAIFHAFAVICWHFFQNWLLVVVCLLLNDSSALIVISVRRYRIGLNMILMEKIKKIYVIWL